MLLLLPCEYGYVFVVMLACMLQSSLSPRSHTLTPTNQSALEYSFGLVFLLATFRVDTPLIGPAVLLKKWHMDNAALVYVVRFDAGLLFGIALYEWQFAKAVKIQPSFNIYHAITAAFMLYSSVAAASYWFGWLYATIITAFFIAGVYAHRMT